MSSKVSATSSDRAAAGPDWLAGLLGVDALPEGASLTLGGAGFVVRDGLLRRRDFTTTSTQEQTSDTFGFKWQRRETFESDAWRGGVREWLVRKYGPVSDADWWADYGPQPLLLDAGCGAGVAALELFGEMMPRLRYLGVDISDAVDVARRRFAERGLSGAFLQADVTALPLPPNSVDVIFSEGVLHHTDSTRGALLSLVPLLKPGGRMLFYVYARKGPIREFVDDLVRARLSGMPPAEAWKILEPLTRLGIALGELGAEIEIPEAIDVLGIPAGRLNVQRLFYWHVAKAFYRPDLTFDEMNHINFDWYAPSNAHRQSPDDVRGWCAEAGMVIEREVIEDAGITLVARRV